MNALFVQGESITSSHFSYDVFLSFRGEDTRKNFTGHLYYRLCQAGVNTFIDDEELRKGDVISRELERAIQESKVSIVVFSRNYASSSWCLDELVKILECKEKLKQIILPIFYDVKPTEVRKQTGEFGIEFAKLKERPFGAERMDKWKAALTEAANLSGWDLRNVADGHESKFIGSIIKQVQQEVKYRTPLDVASHPVGVYFCVEDIELLLQTGRVDEVRMIGIYGVGGIGKTTLAKAIYNRVFRHFDGSCFLSDVRSKVEELGLVKLQEKLLHQILKTKDLKVDIVAEGVNLIKARLESKKVLIILDDVDHRSQLESLARERSWFGSGSLIIITTRDKQLLCGLRENERYKAKLLHPYESLQLFSCHAFKSLSPPQEYDELAQDVIKYSGGLPLALVTLGSHLQGRSIEEWRYEFKKLRAIPHCDIQKILKISFDGLDCDTQDVFLDIACAFHGFPKDEVTKTLNACGFHTESAILTLVQRHLLDRAVVNLTMHDLVRDMGREIVRMESPRDPRKRSRLFNPQEIRDVLQGNKGSEKVEVLMIDSWALKGVNLSTKAFKNMKNLRVLKIDASHISGDFELLSKELRWLSWQKCSLKSIPSNFPAEKLVVLDMQGSNIQEFGLNLQCCKSLNKLNLSYCKKLKRTPNFNGSRSLKTLRFRDCSNLTEIHQSIGSLSRLIYLDLDGCKKLTDLPSSICKLKSLESLNICWCLSLQTLPVGLRDMGGLNTLNAGYAGITQLPGSVEMPRNLVESEIRGQHLEAKAGFSRRRVYRVRVRSLPTCVCCKSLKVLDLSNCKRLRKTPNFNGSRSLETLRFHGCSRLMEIHPSIGNLDRLTELYLYGCKKLMNLPSSICQLKSLRLLNIHRCSSIQTLPVDLGDIRGLKYLNASCTGIKQLPGSVKMLRDLVYLEVGGEAKRSFSRKRVHCIQSLSTFILRLRLTYFKLSEADIPRDIRSLSSLRCFDLSGDSFLCLPFGSVELRFLEYLCLNYYKNLQTIPLVSNLENPEFYEIGNCKKLVDITELDSLSSIEQLNMLNCNALQNPFNEGFFSAFQSRKNWNLGLDIYLQSNEIPDWCSYQVTAPSICFIMPMHNKEYQFLGMIVWCVRKFVNVPSSGTWKGLGFSIAGKMFPDVFSHDDNELPAGHVELSFVFYRSYMQRPFDGQIKCGEKMEVLEVGIENTVKKIGIHLLYLDQQGKVTSLPAIVDQSHSQMKRSREISDKSLSEKEPKKSFNRAYQLNP